MLKQSIHKRRNQGSKTNAPKTTTGNIEISQGRTY